MVGGARYDRLTMSIRWDAWRVRSGAAADALVAWSASAWMRWLGIGGCAALVVAVVWIGMLQGELLRAVVHKDAGATPLDLQLAFTAAEWDWILTHWGPEAIALQVQSLWIDFVLIAGYVCAGVFGLGALARRLPAFERPRRRRMAGYAMAACMVAGVMDAAENVAMLAGLKSAGSRAWLAPLASGCAVLKWSALGGAATYGAAWCSWKWRVGRWEALGRRVRYGVAVGAGLLLGSTLVACAARGDGGMEFGVAMAVVLGVCGAMGFAALPRIEWGIEVAEVDSGAIELGEPEKWNSTIPNMVWIRAGKLDGKRVEAFWISRYPTRRRDWRALGLEVPEPRFWSEADDDDLPANNLNWFDAVQFCNTLSAREGLVPRYYEDEGHTRPWSRRIDFEEKAGETVMHMKDGVDGYRLPSELEWEFACRAGTDTKFHWGDDREDADRFAWFDPNSERVPHRVGLKAPNPAGLHDMTGNVREWCEDWNDRDRDRRALRGGAFFDPASFLASSFPFRSRPSLRNQAIGFRVVRGALPQHGASPRSSTP